MTNTKKLRIFHAQNWKEYSNWVPNAIYVNKIEDADIAWFEGGSDVDPSIYGENKHPRTYTDLSRDKEEKAMYLKAQELNIPCIGICRGLNCGPR